MVFLIYFSILFCSFLFICLTTLVIFRFFIYQILSVFLSIVLFISLMKDPKLYQISLTYVNELSIISQTLCQISISI
ncbi:unnamed protein product [Meloidogyne enterolobii]|uniref:Uncharacterized protein n=2 Tax=Meloidogyne enterolobii TaxID=390850 RepID=A0A6V7YAD2_MELEN|nr:unnamed protein product [Meloidogyne enterolobii]